MMYPFLQLDDHTEIVYSDMMDDGSVKVYIEKPVEGGFHSATCFCRGISGKELMVFQTKRLIGIRRS